MLAAAFAHHQSGQLDDAERLYHAILKRNPFHPDAWHLLAIIARARGQPARAVEYAERAIVAKPQFVEAKNTLGVALRELGRVSSALKLFEEAVKINPAYVDAWYNAGNALQMQGLPTSAAECYRRALLLAPAFEDARSNLLMVMNYSPDFSREEVFAAHRKYAPPAKSPMSHQIHPDPYRRLKIGYVSADFRRHPVAYFLEPILRCHDRVNFEVYCYDNHGSGDDVTSRLRANSDHWRDVVGMTDEEIARMVAADQIDILIDLANHSRGNRLAVFAIKPAPIQITWLGIPQTTGLEGMDFRITDALVDPIGLTESIHTETLLRLADGALAFEPDPAWPAVNALPATANGHITFASFNNLAKVNPAVIAVWAQILQAVAGARLLIAASGDQDDELSIIVKTRFLNHGIASERIEFAGRHGLADFLQLHHQVDIALDPFPCSGVTTTLHSLWMGVPVISLKGDTPISRGGAGILGRLKLGEYLACSGEQYIAFAIGLAADQACLKTLRQSLRSRLTASSFCNPETITRSLEKELRGIWQNWCRGNVT